MKILYLYSEISPYNIPVFKCLTQAYGATIHVVHWDHKKLTPFAPSPIENVFYYKRSHYSTEQIYELAKTIDPDIVYVSGWMDKGYLPIARRFRARGTPVVTGFDDQWVGNLRQRVGVLVFRLYLERCFSHAWVSGPRQYEFVRRLGFDTSHIVFDLYSCDYDLFNEVGNVLDHKRTDYPGCFLFVGRFTHVKGIDLLVKAYQIYQKSFGGDWKLICVGNGDLRYLLESEPGIEVKDFANQQELAELCRRSGVFVLPSRREPWGVVVHEFGAAGLPLLLSDAVGAKTLFLIEGHNGYSFASNSTETLSKAMFALSRKSADELWQMGENSRRLASRITPAISAANLISVVPEYRNEGGRSWCS